MSQHRNKLSREKQCRDTTSRSRQRFQHKCKEVESRHNKLRREIGFNKNAKKSCRDITSWVATARVS